MHAIEPVLAHAIFTVSVSGGDTERAVVGHEHEALRQCTLGARVRLAIVGAGSEAAAPFANLASAAIIRRTTLADDTSAFAGHRALVTGALVLAIAILVGATLRIGTAFDFAGGNTPVFTTADLTRATALRGHLAPVAGIATELFTVAHSVAAGVVATGGELVRAAVGAALGAAVRTDAFVIVPVLLSWA